MKFDLHRPCDDCPFLKKGGIRLTKPRVREIAGMMLSSQGGTFPCHKTTSDGEDGEMVATKMSKHCAGALIFSEKNGNATQIMRIMERIGQYNRLKLMADKKVVDSVFDTLKQMVHVNATAMGKAAPKSARKERRRVGTKKES